MERRPWTAAEAAFADQMLAWRSGVVDTPRKLRGQLVWAKIVQYQDEAPVALSRYPVRTRPVVDGLKVIYAACCRGQDIGSLTLARVSGLDDNVPILWAKRKASQAVLVQRGEYTPNPVCLPAAAEILRRRCAAAEEAGTDLVFEGWDPAAATALVRHTAEIRGWSDAVIWTGAHNARCGAAREVFDQALEKVMHAGMWDTMDSAELYGAPRGGEVDKGAGEQIRLESARAFQQQLAAENAELEKRTLPPAIAARPIAMEGSAGGAPDEPPRTRRGRKDEAAIAKRSATNAPATRKPARNRAQAKSSAAKKPARNRAQAKSPAPRKTARKRPEAKGTRSAANRSGASKDQAKGAGKKSTRPRK